MCSHQIRIGIDDTTCSEGVFSFVLGLGVSQTRAVYQGFFHYKKSCLIFPSRTTGLKMNDGYSYVGIPSTTQEVIAKEDHDHPVSECSETITLAGPEAPAALKQSALTLVGPFLLLIVQNLTSWSKGMEISHNAHRNARFGCHSCGGPSRF
jgi:hypothetical protein